MQIVDCVSIRFIHIAADVLTDDYLRQFGWLPGYIRSEQSK